MNMKQHDNNFRALLTETIIRLCQKEAVYTRELRIEEWIGDTHSLNTDVDDYQHNSFQSQHSPTVLSADQEDLTLPVDQVDHELSEDEIMQSFESPTYAFCQNAEEQLVNDINNSMITSEQSANGQYECLQCNKTCRNERGLQSHIKTHSERQSCACEHCLLVFNSLSKLKQHMKKVHKKWQHQPTHLELMDDDSIDPLLSASEQVNIAEDTAENRSDDDIKINNGFKPEDEASRTLTEEDDIKMLAKDQSKQNLKRHERSNVSISKTPRRKPRKTATIMQYFENIHVETTRGVYHYKCYSCHKMFKLRTSLYEHVSSHTGKRRYTCKHCDRSFIHHSSLHNHVHSKHMPIPQCPDTMRYQCTGCDRGFKYRSLFERHLRSKPDHRIKDAQM